MGVALGQVDSTNDRKAAADKSRLRLAKLTAVGVAIVVVTSLALTYLCTDVFEGLTNKAVIQVNSICYSEDVQYEIVISDTGVKLASGTVISNGTEIHEFKGFDERGITFRYSVFPGQEFECPFLLSDGGVLQINIFRLGIVEWEHSY